MNGRGLLAGLVAGACGTLAMDLAQYTAYRRAGGMDPFVHWEFAAVESWETAPAPAQVARLATRWFLGRDLPDKAAGPANNLTHWGYGTSAALAYVAVSTRDSAIILRGAGFGSAVWLSSYLTLPLLGLYQPIWGYDARTLGKDLANHLVYGTTVAVTVALLRRR